MLQSTIQIEVLLDEQKLPGQINWIAPGTTAENANKAKAMMLSFWDGAEKTALRIDLWTKDMMVDEMADFYFQTLMGMADSYQRATNDAGVTGELKSFARDFIAKFRDQQLKANEA
jgi:gliding motility-associated protein GldC